MPITNRSVRGHWQTVQQSCRTDRWWVSCHCPSGREGIVSRRPVTAASSECESQQAALDLGHWHAWGERGPAPGTTSQLTLFDSTAGGLA